LKDKAGIGQLFFLLKVLPEFRLVECGRGNPPTNGSEAYLHPKAAGDVHMWRTYTLKAEGIECTILEAFYSSLFQIPPQLGVAKM